MKLQLSLILHSVKNNIKIRTEQKWHYKYLPVRSTEGFTLAEVLITLLIIGVVASLVIPALINDTQDAELKVAWKKAYSDIDQATRRVLMDNGGTLNNVFTYNGSSQNLYLNYLNYTKRCTYSTNEGCWYKNNNDASYLNGNLGNGWSSLNIVGTNNNRGAILTNGSMMVLIDLSQDCSHKCGTVSLCSVIYVDVNGFKLPNKVGKDIYGIWVQEKGIKPFGVSGDWFSPDSDCAPTGLGWGCSLKYLYQ